VVVFSQLYVCSYYIMWNAILVVFFVFQVPELPSFMLEPLESHKEEHYRSGPPFFEYSLMEVLSLSNSDECFSNVKINILVYSCS
jgi:hypothetical protein